MTVPPGPLKMKTLRNADLKETSLVVDGRPVLKFAQVWHAAQVCHPGITLGGD